MLLSLPKTLKMIVGCCIFSLRKATLQKKICNINTRNIYLVDDKWVYFSDYGNTIYRILPSGENLQKVM